jgi:hypothetical protein
MLVGDINISDDDRAKLKGCLSKHFHLELKNDPAEQITLSGSCIDLIFSRYMHLIYKPYVLFDCVHFWSVTLIVFRFKIKINQV